MEEAAGATAGAGEGEDGGEPSSKRCKGEGGDDEMEKKKRFYLQWMGSAGWRPSICVVRAAGALLGRDLCTVTLGRDTHGKQRCQARRALRDMADA